MSIIVIGIVFAVLIGTALAVVLVVVLTKKTLPDPRDEARRK